MPAMLGGNAPDYAGRAMERRPPVRPPRLPGQTAAWLTYDYAGQRVWLDDRPPPAGDQWALCAGHAGRLRAPKGWTQVDRRVVQGPGSTARRPGVMSPPEAPASGNRWGLAEAVIGFAVGLLLSAIAATIAEGATGYHPTATSPIPVAVTVADVAGLWLGLIGAVLFASRVRGQGDLGLDYGWGLGRRWDLPAGAAIGLACQYLLIPLLYLPFEHLDRHLGHELGQPARNDSGAAHSVGAWRFWCCFWSWAPRWWRSCSSAACSCAPCSAAPHRLGDRDRRPGVRPGPL